MKRLLILICPFLLFSLASCDSPVSDVDSNSETSQIQPGQVQQMAVLTRTPVAKLDSVRKDLTLQFSARHGYGWKASWRNNGATPSAVFGGTTRPIKGSPEKAARRLLAQNRNLFNMQKGLGDLELQEVHRSSDGLRHVRFQQTYHGIPVYEAGYQVHIRPDGRIDMANGHYYHDIEATTSAGVAASSAERTALADLGGQVKLKWETDPKLMVYRNPVNENFSLSWKVVLPTSEPEAAVWQYFVDAGSGQILNKLNLATSITGEGDIVTDNPVTTPTPVNRNLYRLNGSGYLEGTYANVHNDVANRAFSSSNDFIYSTNNTHFDEANVYYHIDTYRQNYLNTIGFAGVDIGSDLDLEATVHAQDVPINNVAVYIPGSGHEEVRNADITNSPRSAKVTYHEMNHAVADMENGRISSDVTEEGSVSEGQADYFANSYTDDSRLGIAVLTNPRDSENPFIPSFADYENERDNLSPIGGVAPHRGATFFSAILWDIRNGWLDGSASSEGTITQQEADENVFEAIGRVSSSTDFLEFRDAMIAADNSNNGGANADFIQNAFAARGVGDFTPLEASINGPISLNNGSSDTWTVDVTNGDSPYSYTWYRREKSFDGSTFYYQVGTGDSYSGSANGSTDFYLRVDVDDSNGRSGTGFRSIVVGQVDTPPPCEDGPNQVICVERN